MTQEWFEEWFNEDYLLLYSSRDESAGIKEVDFLVSQIPVTSDSAVLDLGCGAGRHAKALANYSGLTVGLDLSELLLNRAMQSDRDVPNLTFVRGDMRTLPFSNNSFSVIVSLFNSFGYFSTREEHLVVLSEARRVLTAGGTLVLDFFNRDFSSMTLVPYSEEQRGTRHFSITRTLTNDGSKVIKTIVATGGGRQDRIYREEVTLFSRAQLFDLLDEVGFTVLEEFGDLSGAPFQASSPQLVLIASAVN